MAGHWARLATTPERAQVIMQGRSKLKLSLIHNELTAASFPGTFRNHAPSARWTFFDPAPPRFAAGKKLAPSALRQFSRRGLRCGGRATLPPPQTPNSLARGT